MTLVARIMFKGAPIYIGDMLLSSEGASDKSVDIPAARDISAWLPPSVARRVSGLRQKLTILDGGHIIAWAGNMLQARSLIKDIQLAITRGARTWMDIQSVVEQVPLEDRDDVSLIGTIVCPETNSFENFCYEVQRISLGDIEVDAAGTGANDIFEIITQLPIGNSEFERDGLFSFKAALAISGVLVGHETFTGQNLLDWWGGAIEVAYLRQGKFEKLANVLHTLWKANKVGGGYELTLVPKFLKYDYFSDAFVAQTWDMGVVASAMGPRAKIREHTYRIYTSLLKSARDYDLSQFEPPDFNHTTLSCYVLMQPPIPHLGNLSHVYHSGSGDTPFRLTVHRQGIIQISYQGQLVVDLQRVISEATGLPAKFCKIGY